MSVSLSSYVFVAMDVLLLLLLSYMKLLVLAQLLLATTTPPVMGILPGTFDVVTWMEAFSPSAPARVMVLPSGR